MAYFVLVHNRYWRLLTSAHARGRRYFHVVLAQRRLQLVQQACCTGHVTTEAITDTHCKLGCRLAIANDFKVMVESCDLIDLGHWDVHQLGQGHQMTLLQTTVKVID